jgi:hypothetical protein
MTSQEQAFELGRAWEGAPEPKRQFVLQIVHPDMKVDTFRIGPHTPTMKTEDVHLVHRLWLNITREPGLEKVHHHDILTEALTRFAHDYAGMNRSDILRELRKTTGRDALTTPIPGVEDGGRKQAVTPPGPEPEASPEQRKKEEDGPPGPPLVGP